MINGLCSLGARALQSEDERGGGSISGGLSFPLSYGETSLVPWTT